ncbi:MAG: energy transducer TonB [Bacteroidales bacterium]|jgi:protein TonB|nr:energy transducer TonB [Bacteroidales bacterium]MDD4703700.1 energy transducer TonB [Bacteroidales bacterium]MDX9797993.1 energy transducer TonB [Bacteroidales bacterium]
MNNLFKPLSLFAVLLMISAFTLNVNAQEKKSDNSDVVYTVVENEAEFPGGVAAMNRFLAENIKYPTLAKQKNIEGKVIISFIVEKNGSLSDIRTIKDIGEGCGDEGIRIVRLMPKWKPAKQKGQPVRQQFLLPISFVLTNK